MGFEIRPHEERDYPSISYVNNAVYREYPQTVEEIRYDDEHRDPKLHFERWVAEVDGDVVAAGTGQHFGFMFHPRKFYVSVMVHPEYEGRGVGGALYRRLLERLAPKEPIALRCGVREDMERGLRFARSRGFVEDTRAWESRLDLGGFDFAAWTEKITAVREQGIELRTLAELRADPDHLRRLYALDEELSRDVPRPEPEVTFDPFDVWRDRMETNPNLLPEGYFVAVDNGEYVGLSQLWNSQSGGEFYTGLTGVKRSHRRRGIALALKLRAIEWAMGQGVARLKTWNESNNRPMLSINEALGFVRQPAWIDFRKTLREENA